MSYVTPQEFATKMIDAGADPFNIPYTIDLDAAKARCSARVDNQAESFLATNSVVGFKVPACISCPLQECVII